MRILRKNNMLRHRGTVNLLFLIGLLFILFVMTSCNSVDRTPADEQVSKKDDTQIDADPVIDGQTEEESNYTKVRLAAAGDFMFHDDQLTSAFNSADNTYDFVEMFQEVAPIFNAADLAIANFETTMAGPDKGFKGYPQFNSPDEVADAIKGAGIDVLTTANNHSLDTGGEGLKRTVDVLQDKGFQTVGTYSETPNSHVLYVDVDSISFAILSYTESTNGLGNNYPADELNNMLNMMTKENIERDMKEAREADVDFIITFMHWGEEYQTEPNDTQRDYAHFMAEQGVDLILGSHPHVIQPSEMIETAEKDVYVLYSMGNFISNQRAETLGDEYALTEDGIIVNFDIQKNNETKETKIINVEYIPTWVYRDEVPGKSTFTYRVLPIEHSLLGDEISAIFKERMERSFDTTMAQMHEFNNSN